MLGGSTTWSSMLTRTRSSIFMTLFYPVPGMTVSAQSVNDHASIGRPPARLGRCLDRSGYRPARRRPRDVRQPGLRGRAADHRLAPPRPPPDRVRRPRRGRGGDARRHVPAPPAPGGVDPAGCTHQATLHAAVTTISVLFEPPLVPAAGDQVRILAASPLIREMVHARRALADHPPRRRSGRRRLLPHARQPRRRRAPPRVGPRSAHLRRSRRGRGDRLHAATPGDRHARGDVARRSASRSGPSVDGSRRGSTCHGGRT